MTKRLSDAGIQSQTALLAASPWRRRGGKQRAWWRSGMHRSITQIQTQTWKQPCKRPQRLQRPFSMQSPPVTVTPLYQMVSESQMFLPASFESHYASESMIGCAFVAFAASCFSHRDVGGELGECKMDGYVQNMKCMVEEELLKMHETVKFDSRGASKSQ